MAWCRCENRPLVITPVVGIEQFDRHGSSLDVNEERVAVDRQQLEHQSERKQCLGKKPATDKARVLHSALQVAERDHRASVRRTDEDQSRDAQPLGGCGMAALGLFQRGPAKLDEVARDVRGIAVADQVDLQLTVAAHLAESFHALCQRPRCANVAVAQIVGEQEQRVAGAGPEQIAEPITLLKERVDQRLADVDAKQPEQPKIGDRAERLDVVRPVGSRVDRARHVVAAITREEESGSGAPDATTVSRVAETGTDHAGDQDDRRLRRIHAATRRSTAPDYRLTGTSGFCAKKSNGRNSNSWCTTGMIGQSSVRTT